MTLLALLVEIGRVEVVSLPLLIIAGRGHETSSALPGKSRKSWKRRGAIAQFTRQDGGAEDRRSCCQRSLGAFTAE